MSNEMTPQQKYEFSERELKRANQVIAAHENRIRILTKLLDKYNPQPTTDGGIAMEEDQFANGFNTSKGVSPEKALSELRKPSKTPTKEV